GLSDVAAEDASEQPSPRVRCRSGKRVAHNEPVNQFWASAGKVEPDPAAPILHAQREVLEAHRVDELLDRPALLRWGVRKAGATDGQPEPGEVERDDTKPRLELLDHVAVEERPVGDPV